MSVTDEIKERLDIVEVISQYVPLKKAGRNYKGLCPFHNEKTPSFVVFPDGQNWHCFGACGTGGDIFSFVMKRENLDFTEALALLAAKAGVELQPRDGPQPAAEQHLERLREIIASAAGYFHYLLIKSGEAAVARDYLTHRGLVQATWEGWQLGYALESWSALSDHLGRKGYTLEEMEEAGLVIRRESGDGYYDRFRGRLLIPIRDGQGRTVGFGARLLREDPAFPQPKYINSPQTPLFDKSNVVFGLDMARKAIREADLAVIVEGYMDVLMSHQVGVCNVVAGMGTALTEAQIRQIKRYSSNITLALDPDTAGDNATLRGLETARQALGREWEPVLDPLGLVRQESRLKAQLRIATLPDALDPDELARADPGRWRQVLTDAQPIVDYYLAIVGKEEDLTTARGKANAVARLAPLIREIGSPVERAHYTQILARLVQTDERIVAAEVEATRRADRSRRPVPILDSGTERGVVQPANTLQEEESGGEGGEVLSAAEGVRGQYAATGAGRLDKPAKWDSPPSIGLEEHVLGYLLYRPDLISRLDFELAEYNAPPLRAEDFANPENRAILVGLQAGLRAAATEWEGASGTDGSIVLEALLDSLPQVLHARCRALVAHTQRYPVLTDEKLAKDVGDSLLRLREENLRREINQLRFLIMEGEETGTREQLRQYHDLMVSYTAQKRHVQRLLNARTMVGALNSQQAARFV